MELLLMLILLTAAFAAGILGSMLGIGGGIIVVPTLTLALNLPIHMVIGASIVAVIATSSAAATVYVHERLVNIRLGIILETATASGAIVGALLIVFTAAYPASKQVLSAIFGIVLIYAAFYITYRPEISCKDESEDVHGKFCLSGEYCEKGRSEKITYKVEHIRRGLLASFAAGTVSGTLGVGGGIIKVPAMNVWMKVPMKVATATSNFMIGVTAAASAVIYYSHGFIDPVIASLVATGVFFGAMLGSRMACKVESTTIRKVFAVALVFVSVLMFTKAFG
jgi:hypothetical protein